MSSLNIQDIVSQEAQNPETYGKTEDLWEYSKIMPWVLVEILY